MASLFIHQMFMEHPGSTKLNSWDMDMSLSHVQLFVTPWSVACQAPPSMGFSWQEYWKEYYFLLQGIFPTQGSNSSLLHCRQTLYHLSHQGSPFWDVSWNKTGESSLCVKLAFWQHEDGLKLFLSYFYFYYFIILIFVSLWVWG